MSDWQPISTAPETVWLNTRRDGEDSDNVCFLRVWPCGEKEWIERGGRTTITHSSFAPPTHWRHLSETQEAGND